MSQGVWNGTLARQVDEGVSAMVARLGDLRASGVLLVQLNSVYEIGMRVNAAATELRTRVPTKECTR